MRFSVLIGAALSVTACSGAGGNNSASAPANVSANAQRPAYKTTVTEWQTTPSGLRYRRIGGTGAGPKPSATDTVTIHYVGRLMDGTEFDSSVRNGGPVTMALPDLIPGWQEGVPLMGVGDVFEFEVPPALGYGERGSGPIPPNSTLRFTIGLLSIGGR